MNNNRIARKLLAKKIKTAEDFDAFCLDHFPQCKLRFATDMNRLQRENLLLEMEGADKIISEILSKKERTSTRLSNFHLIASICLIMISAILLLSRANNPVRLNNVDSNRDYESKQPSQINQEKTATSSLVNNGTILTTGEASPVTIDTSPQRIVINNGTVITTGRESGITMGSSQRQTVKAKEPSRHK